jgi:rRNA maturation endonuclease Nob1
MSVMISMEQELVYEIVAPSEDDVDEELDALTVCKECKHLVPKTMLCLWCGSPILFKSQGKLPD